MELSDARETAYRRGKDMKEIFVGLTII
jgi:hypothetical protein